MNIAIVGYGIRGQKMAKLTVKNFDKYHIYAICDIDEKKLAQASLDFPDAKIYKNFQPMIADPSIDVLFVETPAPFHTEFVIAALNRDIHVLSDVPAVDTYKEAEQLWQAHLKCNSIYMMQATTNMYGYIAEAEKMYKAGLFGDPYYIEAEYIHNLSELFGETPWRENYENIKYSTHCLGPSLKFMQEELETVSCFDTGSHVDRIAGRHDAMVAIFKTRSGIVLKLLVSFINHCPAHGQSYRFYFTEGYFERTHNIAGENSGTSFFYTPHLHRDKKLHNLEIGEQLSHNRGKNNLGNHGGANYELLRRFFHAIENNLPSPISLQESLRMTIPGIFAAESAQKDGSRISIRYPWND